MAERSWSWRVKHVLIRGMAGPVRLLSVQLDRARHERALAGLRLGRGAVVGANPEIHAPECIEIGEGVRIGRNVRLQGIVEYAGQMFNPRLVLKRGASLQNQCTVICNNYIELGEDVMVASNVFISDHEHLYQDVKRPIVAQELTTDGRVVIGAGSHIGENVCIFRNVTIGEHCVIGAGAVVTRDVPAFSVAVGSPARVVRQFDAASGEWRRV
jgi:acetyltransferase-like isoleucine patch superfamily enzyme